MPAPDDCDRAMLLAATRAERVLTDPDSSWLDDHLADCEPCNDAIDDDDVQPALVPLAWRTGAADAGADFAELPVIDPETYVWGDQIARGGMGRIVRARDRRLGRMVAIKELLSDELRARFEREARLTARLEHPAIVHVHEAGCWPSGDPFFVMKLVDGETLEARIARCASLDERLALLPVVVIAVEAMAYAHAEGVVHRDIKPRNIIVGPFGETVVIDWGLAKDLRAPEPDADDPAAAADATDDHVTRSGAGTPSYMSIEQARGDAADPRMDVFALGATLYHSIAGAPPYSEAGETALSTVRDGGPTPLARRAPETPRELLAIVDKAMAADADDRYPSAKELAEDLQRYLAGRLVSAHRYSLAQRVARFVRKHRWPVIAAAAGIVLVVGTIVSARWIAGARDDADRSRDQAAAAARGRITAEQRLRDMAIRQSTSGEAMSDRLEDLYLDAGYLEATVQVGPPEGDTPGALTIVEGPRYKVGRVIYTEGWITLQGQPRERSSEHELIDFPGGVERGDWFSVSRVRDHRTRIINGYRAEGFAFANVTPVTDIDRDAHEVKVTFELERGKRATIRMVRLEGDPAGAAEARPHVTFKGGDPYPGRDIDDTRDFLREALAPRTVELAEYAASDTEVDVVLTIGPTR